MRQISRFITVGIASTLAYVALYAMLHGVLAPAPVMALDGLSGVDRSPALGKHQWLVASRQLRHVLLDANGPAASSQGNA